MKKAKLLGAIALMFALVLGAASCAQDSTPSGSKPSGTAPSGNESSGSDTNDATDNNNTNSGGTQNSTPSGSNPSGHKPSGTAPSGTADIKDVIDNPDVDLSGTWKLTDAYIYGHLFARGPNGEVQAADGELKKPEEVAATEGALNIFGIELDNNLCTEFSNDFFKNLVAEFEEMEKGFEEMKEEIEKQQAEVDADFDWYLKVNGDYNEIYIYYYQSLYEPDVTESDQECILTFKKQQ